MKLTREQILDAKAGPELNNWLAEHVMGWRRKWVESFSDQDGSQFGGYHYWAENESQFAPKYSTSIAHAVQALIEYTGRTNQTWSISRETLMDSMPTAGLIHPGCHVVWIGDKESKNRLTIPFINQESEILAYYICKALLLNVLDPCPF